MTLYLSDMEVGRLLSTEIAIQCLDAAFKDQATGGAINLPRRRIPLRSGSYNTMSAAWLERDVVGEKSYVATRHGVGFFVLLYNTTRNGLIAMFEANSLGQIRTGAASGLASRYMARPDSETVGMIGTGYQAQSQLESVVTVLPIKSAKIYSRSLENREKFALEMSDKLGIEIIGTTSAEEAIKGADVLITVTGSSTPVLFGDWLVPGVHINAAGANSWMRRELDNAAVSKANMIITDDVPQARVECADLMQAAETGRLNWQQVFSLADITSGRITARSSPDDITLFESQGVALEDIAVAEYLYKMATNLGVGTKIGN